MPRGLVFKGGAFRGLSFARVTRKPTRAFGPTYAIAQRCLGPLFFKASSDHTRPAPPPPSHPKSRTPSPRAGTMEFVVFSRKMCDVLDVFVVFGPIGVKKKESHDFVCRIHLDSLRLFTPKISKIRTPLFKNFAAARGVGWLRPRGEPSTKTYAHKNTGANKEMPPRNKMHLPCPRRRGP